MLVVLQQGRRLHGHCMHYSFIALDHTRVSQHPPKLHKCTNSRDNNNTMVNAHIRIHHVAQAVSCVRCRCCCCCAVVCALGCLFDGSASKDLGPLQQRKVTKAKPKPTHHELALLAATAALAGLPPYLRACHTTQRQRHHHHHTTKVLMINDTNITTATSNRKTHNAHPHTSHNCNSHLFLHTPLLLRTQVHSIVLHVVARTQLRAGPSHVGIH